MGTGMRWRAFVAFLVLALALLAAPTTSLAVGKPGGGGSTAAWDYVALGDSLATGFGARKGYVPRYKDYVQTDTGASVKLNNLGQNGWTSTDLLNALKTNGTFQKAVSGAEVLTWDIGGNDLRAARDQYKQGTCGGSDNQDCLRATVATFKSNWDGIIAEILARRTTANTIIRTMDIYNAYVNEDKADGSFTVLKGYLDDVNAYIGSTAGGNGIPYAKVYEAFNGPNGDQDPEDKGYLSLDGLHPNDKGHKVIADLFRGLGYAPLK